MAKQSISPESIAQIDMNPSFIELQEQKASKFASKLQRGYFKQKVLKSDTPLDYIPPETPIFMRKAHKRPAPKPDEIVDICYGALVDFHPLLHLSKRHGLSVGAIQ